MYEWKQRLNKWRWRYSNYCKIVLGKNGVAKMRVNEDSKRGGKKRGCKRLDEKNRQTHF